MSASPHPFLSLLSTIRHHHRRSQPSSPRTSNPPLPQRLAEVFATTWDLGFTAFGGPPVHFQILHQRFVKGGRSGQGKKWCDEDTYQELFAICQGLPGPASTKLVFCLVLLNAGFLPALLAFFLWSLPGAVGMYALSLGVQGIDDVLPLPVYALLSGLNSAIVGVIALAAIQLAERSISDRLSRILVIFGACAGLCYNALWYFPLLMSLGGLAAVVWDGWMSQRIGKAKASLRLLRRRRNDVEVLAVEIGATNLVPLEVRVQGQPGIQRRGQLEVSTNSTPSAAVLPQTSPDVEVNRHTIHIRVGVIIIILFFASFIAILVARAVEKTPPLALDLFATMYVAGTVIFGGGPVVIPLLRSYVVDPGWVSGRDFLLGLAIIQAFPGPNFNFGVYLGALAMQKTQIPTILGAFLGFVGLFAPGLMLLIGVQSFWPMLRRKKWILDLLRGVNATAVGLVFTAIYRLWEIGYLTAERSSGRSLGLEPWWVVTAAITYAENAWFRVPSAMAIAMGAVLGLCWYGVIGR